MPLLVLCLVVAVIAGAILGERLVSTRRGSGTRPALRFGLDDHYRDVTPTQFERGDETAMLEAGDEAAIPAIRQALAALPADAQGYAVLQVDGPSYQQEVATPAGVELTWLHRTNPEHASLVDTVRGLAWREGRVHAFVHGEGEAVMRGIRPYLLTERSVPRADVSISAYWKQGRTEETFREWKSEIAKEDQ